MALGKSFAELHNWVEARLSDYLDNQLPSAERAKLEQHVSDCAQCRSSLDSIRWTIALVKQAPAPVTKKSFGLAVPPKREPSLAFSFARLATVMAVLLLFTIIGIDVITQMGNTAGSVAMAPAAQKDIAPTRGGAFEQQAMPTSAPTALPMPASASSSAAGKSGVAPFVTTVPPTVARSNAASASAAPAPTKAPEPASASLPPQVAPTITDNAAKSQVAPTATVAARQGVTGAAEISATATIAPTQTATPVPTATVAPTLVARVVPTLAPTPTSSPVAMQSPVPLMRIVEIGILFLAIFFATLTILLRRKK